MTENTVYPQPELIPTLEEYATLWTKMEITDAAKEKARSIAKRLVGQADMYVGFGGVPWYLVAVLHYKEAHLDPKRQILNGEPFSRKTRMVPVGLGPWNDWRESTEFAVKYWLGGVLKDIPEERWCVPLALMVLERWNGLGYRRRGIHTPYLWCGTPYYKSGAFFSDGRFQPKRSLRAVGAAVVLRVMYENGDLTDNDVKPVVDRPIVYDPHGLFASVPVRILQDALNRIRLAGVGKTKTKALKVDGIAGPRTNRIVKETLGFSLKGVYHVDL